MTLNRARETAERIADGIDPWRFQGRDDKCVDVIASALSAARDDGLEEAALLAEGWMGSPAMIRAVRKNGKGGEAAFKIMRSEAACIAEAIRSGIRARKGGAHG